MSSGIPATIRTSWAYWRSQNRQPAERGSSIGPGTMKHSRPCSSAHAAVIRAPLFSAASTTIVASDSPLIRRLRRGKALAVGVGVGRELRDDGAAVRDDRVGEVRVGPREEPAVAGAEDRDRDAALRGDGRLGRAVDPDREPRDDDRPGLAIAAPIRAAISRPASVGRRVPTTATAARRTARRRRRGRTGRAAASRSPAAGLGYASSSRVRTARPAASDPVAAPEPDRGRPRRWPPRPALPTTRGPRRRRPRRARPRRRAGRPSRIARPAAEPPEQRAEAHRPEPVDGHEDGPGLALVKRAARGVDGRR